MIGSVVNYRYEVLEKIGDGNFFSVYKARDKVLNRLVAVKILNAKYAEDEEFAQRICSEIQTASELAHANITRTYECDRQDKVWFVVPSHVYCYLTILSLDDSIFFAQHTAHQTPDILLVIDN